TAEYDGVLGARVLSYAIRPDGTLSELGSLVVRNPFVCHLSFDRTGRYVFASSIFGGAVSVLPVSDEGALLEAVAVVEFSGTPLVPAGERPQTSLNSDPT